MNRKRVMKGLTQDIKNKNELIELEQRNLVQIKKEKQEAIFWSKASLPGSQASLKRPMKDDDRNLKLSSKSLFVSGNLTTFEDAGLMKGPLRELNAGKEIYKEYKESDL